MCCNSNCDYSLYWFYVYYQNFKLAHTCYTDAPNPNHSFKSSSQLDRGKIFFFFKSLFVVHFKLSENKKKLDEICMYIIVYSHLAHTKKRRKI